MEKIYGEHYPCMEQPRQTKPSWPVTAHFMTNQYVEMAREYGFPEERDPQVWSRWRKALRSRLREILSIDEWGPSITPEVVVLEKWELEGYVRQKIAYETLPGNWATAYLLIPDREGKGPAVLCPHGHFAEGSLSVVDPSKAAGVAYGHELAKRGFVVLAPDNAGMGERDVAAQEDNKRSGCELLFRRMNHIGRDLTGFRVFELMIGLNLLQSLPFVDVQRLGCAGLSGGCWLSQVLTALDDRIKAVILSGYFTTFAQTAWIGHCVCHHPHGIGKLCDMSDLSALIAPRPQFVESGKQDFSYPAEPAFSLVRQAYQLNGAEDNLNMDHYDGGHMFYGVHSIPWLEQQLTGNRINGGN